MVNHFANANNYPVTYIDVSVDSINNVATVQINYEVNFNIANIIYICYTLRVIKYKQENRHEKTTTD